MHHESGFFTLTELTKRLDCDRGTLRRQILYTGCPHTPVGAETYFVASEFLDWLKGRQVRLTPEPSPPHTGPAAFAPNPPTDRREKTLRGRGKR